MSNRALNMYKKVYVESASPSRVLDELLGRCLRDLDDAAASIAQKNVLKKREATDHALAIVTELLAALDHSTAPELCKNLERLYLFARDKIVAGSAEMNTVHLQAAADVVTSLRSSFRQASELSAH